MNWNDTSYGDNRRDRSHDYFDETDGYDGYSDADYPQLAGRTCAGIEDRTMLDGLKDIEDADLPTVNDEN